MFKKKSLGQNFLKSSKAISDIVSASLTKSGDFVLEIGPGEGVLTYSLLKSGAHVVAVEKDNRLIPFLEEKFKKEISENNLEVIHGDILENETLSKIKTICKNKSYKIVANIPYYITGQIFRIFLESTWQPSSMTVLVQKEVAERIVAKDGKESLLSLSVKVFGEPKLVRVVGRGAFSPQPNVDSAVLHIENISKNNFKQKDQEETFFKLIHAGFAHKRKKLLSNLSSIYDKSTLLDAFSRCELSETCRAEEVTLDKWLDLSAIL